MICNFTIASLRDPRKREKINLSFYFLLLKALQAFIKPFEAPQKI